MFYDCINKLKLTLLYNKKGFIIRNNKKNLKILKILIQLNIIKFLKIKNKNIIVYVNYINNKPVFINIINLFKPSRKIFISLKNLKKISEKRNWILIISTSKGLMTNFEAIQNKLGGVLITKFWN